jgi:hypothetical protein
VATARSTLPPVSGISPAYYSMHGRAEAFAAALGDGRITPEHVLLALLWDPSGHSSQLLWRLGVSRERLVERLRELAVQVPAAPLPPQREIEWGERVWFDRRDVGRVIDQLPFHIPPATRWGFNYADDRAWAVAESKVDLHGLVTTALARRQARPSWQMRPASRATAITSAAETAVWTSAPSSASTSSTQPSAEPRRPRRRRSS